MNQLTTFTPAETAWIKKTLQAAMKWIPGSDEYLMVEGLKKRLKPDEKLLLLYREARTLERVAEAMLVRQKQIEAGYKKRIKSGNIAAKAYLEKCKLNTKMLQSIERKAKKCL